MAKLRMADSIYQQNGSGYGLTVKDGMLINNRADGISGIRQMADMKKEFKRQEKIDMIAQGNLRAEEMKKFVL